MNNKQLYLKQEGKNTKVSFDAYMCVIACMYLHRHMIYTEKWLVRLCQKKEDKGAKVRKRLHLVSLSFETSELTLQSFCLSTHSVQVRRTELICKVKQRIDRPNTQTDHNQSDIEIWPPVTHPGCQASILDLSDPNNQDWIGYWWLPNWCLCFRFRMSSRKPSSLLTDHMRHPTCT